MTTHPRAAVVVGAGSGGGLGGYVSDDEAYTTTKGLLPHNRSHPHSHSHHLSKGPINYNYSREDFKDIYCINQKAVEGLEKSRSTGFLFLGCLSSYQESPCKRRLSSSSRSTSTDNNNFFTSCYSTSADHQQDQQQRQQDQQRQRQYGGAPLEGYHHYHQYQYQQQQHDPIYQQGSSSSSSHRVIIDPSSASIYQQMSTGGKQIPTSGSSVGGRDSLYSEAKRFTWNEQMEAYVEVLPSSSSSQRQQTSSTSHVLRTPACRYPSAPLSSVHSTLDSSSRAKHVSFTDSYFTRSATSTSFDEHKIRRAKLLNVSQERLLDLSSATTGAPSSGRRTPQQQPMHQQLPPAGGGLNYESSTAGCDHRASQLSLSRTSLTSCRTAATQTDSFIVRAQGPPQYLSLSPRTSHRVGYAIGGGANRNFSRMVSQGAQTVNNGSPAAAAVPPAAQHSMTSRGTSPPAAAATSSRIMDLVETTEEEFHENILRLFSPEDDAAGVATGGTTTSATSPTTSAGGGGGGGRSSEEGSYSLTPSKVMRMRDDDDDAGRTKEEEDEDLLLEEAGSSMGGDYSPVFDDVILRPPEGFADSASDQSNHSNAAATVPPAIPPAAAPPSRKPVKKKRASVRAKSEERYHQQMALSDTSCPLTKMDASTQSSISLQHHHYHHGAGSLHDLSSSAASFDDLDDDSGIHLDAYTRGGVWVYIGRAEESDVWRVHSPLRRTTSGDSTQSEREFSRRYVALTHRMVHRKASGETYRRLQSNALEISKRVTLTRSNDDNGSGGGEYGFRIHGSRPVVVSAVESHSPAEDARLQVGDVIISINGIHVLDASHSDVVRVASQAKALELELASTADINRDVISDGEDDVIVCEGEVEKLSGGSDVTTGGGGVRRLLRLRRDGSLYLYKLPAPEDGGGATTPTPPLRIFSVTKPSGGCAVRVLEDGRTVVLLSRRGGGDAVFLAFRVGDESSVSRWVGCLRDVIAAAAAASGGVADRWIALSEEYAGGPPSSIPQPVDCEGVVWKLGRRVKVWGRRLAILKDAVLFFYQEQQQESAGGAAVGAVYLQGYRVQTVSILGGKRHAFELLPPDQQQISGGGTMRHYYLATDSEHDRKRWLAALEYSIDRWINVGGHQGSGSGGVGGVKF